MAARATGLVVHKYGGSSVGSLAKIQAVARRLAHRQRAGGERLVVVVSAMQGETDRLLALAHGISAAPDGREADQLLATGEQVAAALLAMALIAEGVPARSLSGAQLRLRTDGVFARARVHSLDVSQVLGLLAAGRVVVATGFQGVDAEGNLTTLGRGGSDTSAVAIAAALGAAGCEIYTDVDGVYTADPRVCPQARKLARINFDEMMEMASLGARVLQIRSVELAMNHKLPLRMRSSTSDDPGTLIDAGPTSLERVNVCGVSHQAAEARLTLRHIPDRPGVAAHLFAALARAGINVDVIVQNSAAQGLADLSFTVGRDDRRAARAILAEVAAEVGAGDVEVDDNIGKVSIVGVGMMSHPGVAAAMFAALHEAGINILIITTSEIKVTCVVPRGDTERAVRALHAAFRLDAAAPVSPLGEGALAPAAARRRAAQGPGLGARPRAKKR